MSSTNKTATIELSQYVGTDKPTYLVDYNGDMLKIDNAIAADRDSITTAQNTADGAVTKADANKGSIDAINTQLNGDPEVPGDSGLSGDVTAIEGVVNTVTSLIGTGSPTTSEQTIIGAINGLEGTIAPREDGLLMANSYTVGKQFARGGTVYEVLQNITAGTAFASLVLNTDYKVADTLVEQIANAGSAVVLPDGYYLKEIGTITSTTQSSTTIKNAQRTLADLILAAAQALGDDEFIELVSVDAYNTPKSITADGANRYDNTATAVTSTFTATAYNSASTSFTIYTEILSTALNTNGNSILNVTSGAAVSFVDNTGGSAGNYDWKVTYKHYKKF